MEFLTGITARQYLQSLMLSRHTNFAFAVVLAIGEAVSCAT